MAKEPVSFRSASPDEVRKELDGKIEQKLPIWVFILAVTIMVGIFGYLALQMNGLNDKISKLETRIAIQEKLQDRPKGLKPQ